MTAHAKPVVLLACLIMCMYDFVFFLACVTACATCSCLRKGPVGPQCPHNVFARMAKGRGDTQPCPWNFGPLSRTGGLLLYKRTCSFQIQACKHTLGDCLFFPEGGALSPHPANSASQLAGKGLLGGPFSGAVSSETGAVGRGPTLTGKGRATSTRLFHPLCSENSSSEFRTVRKSLGSYGDTPCV